MQISGETRQELVRDILEICKRDDITGFGREYEFIFLTPEEVKEMNPQNPFAFVLNEEAKEGEFKIYVDTQSVIEEGEKKFSKVIIHEMEHLKQFYGSEVLGKNQRVTEKLKGKASQSVRDSINEINNIFTHRLFAQIPPEIAPKNERHVAVEQFRTLLQNYLQYLLYEGLAVYAEEDTSFGKDRKIEMVLLDKISIPLWTRENLTKSHELAARRTAGLNNEIEEFFNNPGPEKLEEVENKMYNNQYDVGFHLVFTILWVKKDLEREELYNMSHLEFLKLYEKCIEQTGLKPVISVNSREGLLDYDQKVREWAEIVKNLSADNK